VRRAALVPLVGVLLLLVGLGGVGAETYRLAWSHQTGDEVWSVSISSDGSHIAAGSTDNRVYLFSRSSSAPLWSYQTGGYAFPVSISSDGNYIAAGSRDYRVYLFSRSSSAPLWSYQTGGIVRSVSISSDGSYIAAGSRDNRVYLFSRSSSAPLWSYQTSGWVESVSISSDGSYIAAGSRDNRVYLFSRSSSTPLWSHQTGDEVWSVSISSDGSYIAAGSRDNRVYLFSRSSSAPLWSHQTGGSVWSVSISSDGSYIAAGSGDGKVHLFSRFSGLLWSYQTGNAVWSVSISSDGNYIAAGSTDFRVYLFSRSSSTPLWSYQTGGKVYPISISSDGSYIAAGSLDDRVYLFSKNHPPALSSGSVSPGAGTTRDTFTYEVTYSDPDGDPPSCVTVYIDGNPHAMTYASGSYTAGAVYRYQATLPLGSHTYFFEASDGTDTVRLPSSGTYSGPSVELQPTSLSVSPPSFTLGPGEHQTLTATLTAGGTPLPGRAVSWSTTAGSVYPSSGLTGSSGRVTAVYTAPDTPTTATITASFAGDVEYGSSYGLSSATVRLQTRLRFVKPDGTPLAHTAIYYGTSEGQETALLGTTDSEGWITLPDWMQNTTVYFRSEDGRYRGSSYIPSGGGTLSVQLTGTPGRDLLPLVLILAVIGGVAVAGTVAWRRGLLRRSVRPSRRANPRVLSAPTVSLSFPPTPSSAPSAVRRSGPNAHFLPVNRC
jgi:WD40 repeat protein